MLLVKTYIGPSRIHGIGLYADQEIKSGTQIWQYHPNTTQIFNKRDYLKICHELPLPALLEFINFSYIKNGNFYYLNDKTRFINHHEGFNIQFEGLHSLCATRNIRKHEELLEDYSQNYDKDDFYRLPINDSINKEELLMKLCRWLDTSDKKNVS